MNRDRLRQRIILQILYLLVGFASIFFFTTCKTESSNNSETPINHDDLPNILIILTDDQVGELVDKLDTAFSKVI